MIRYTIGMLNPHSHLYDLQISIDDHDGSPLDLIMPSWTPGSYMIREYARHVQEFAASDGTGEALRWEKRAKDCWRIFANGASTIEVRYRVYAFELTVRTSHLDGSHGYFNGTTVFCYVDGKQHEPIELDIITPVDWAVATGLQRIESHSPISIEATCHSFRAADYDELVDCPCECGTHRLLEFTVDEIPHQIAIWGEGNYDPERLIADTQRIVEVQRDMFGGLPYRDYTFIVHLTDGKGGGLEHRNSVTNMLDRWTFRPERSYERYLSLTSHELFHVWNIKRIRPEVLGPFDYRSENYTRLLWMVEGITSYYDDLLLVRAGLLSPKRFLERTAEEIARLQSQPGRLIQSLEQSSFDAWIKLYRPDEHSSNSSISYYLKGSLVAMILDLEIRAQSSDEADLDDVLRELFTRYRADGKGIAEEGGFWAALEAAVGDGEGRYRAIYERLIAATDELDYNAALAHAGLQVVWEQSATPAAWLGIEWKRQGTKTVVASVRSDGPAYAAGVYPDDELIACDGWRVDEARLTARLRERAVGAAITLSLFRGDRLVEITIASVAAPPSNPSIVPVEQPTARHRQILSRWLPA